MSSVYKIAYQPVFEGMEEEDIAKAEEAEYEFIVVVADSLEEAIKKARKDLIGKELKDWFEPNEEEAEGWKKEDQSEVVEDVIILLAQHIATIDIGI